MGTDSEDDRDWAACGAAREVKPERELLQQARDGDSRAAIELLMWPRLYRREMIDPEVMDAIIDGALDVAHHVANTVKVKGDKKSGAVVPVKPLMFFNGANHRAMAKHGRKDKVEVERIIGAIVANGDLPFDKDRLTDADLKVALTTDFQRPGLPIKTRPELYRDVQARLVQFVRWKYSRDVSSESEVFGRNILEIDEELCEGLISVSFRQYQWHRDRDKKFTYPPEWD
ncbi:hypothetical protein MQC88_03235 [Luteimonas sp. 50]|uniref:Uncharacterized protein n=1 Tax=Cognatiluteimonas sedimenti TaxID=2927791 RepID=A0ABT0A1W7_9GAMM|nr:hypothetical protein [Lysobacter sedimenti]MCJ0824982.1 hypothetical protein [Lysobacter sedimenti]